MKNLENLERKAQQNQKLAQNEIEFARNFKLEAKSELKKAKISQKLFLQEMEIAMIRETLAEKKFALVQRKKKIKDEELLKITDEELKHESDYANYYKQLAKNSSDIAIIHKETASEAEKIAKLKLNLAFDKMTLAHERNNLAKQQFQYIKLVRENASENKITNTEQKYKNQGENVWKIRDKLIKKENQMKSKENELANLKKQLSLKLSEREKIIHLA